MSDMRSNALEQRLKFLELDDSARQRLAAAKPHVDRVIGPALDRFYTKVRATPEMARMFTGDAHMDAAKSRQAQHWGIITEGKYGDSYVKGITAVGHAHARIGLEPRWYIGGYALVLEHLIEGIVSGYEEDIRKKRLATSDVAKQVSTVVKAALLDMDYAITVYLDTLAAERAAAEEEKRKSDESRELALGELARTLELLSQGNLEARIPDDLPEQFQPMAEAYNTAVEELRKAMISTRQASERIFASSNDIANASAELSRRTMQQAASIEESSAALTELSESVRETSEGAEKAADAASAASKEAARSGEIVKSAMQAMEEITQSSEKIGAIIDVIDNIAFQTSLLALNAGVEAARAGDAGRSFAVVAQEVRELAQRSARAAKEISQLIATSRSQVENGTQVVAGTAGALSKISGHIVDMNELVSHIAHSAREQSLGLTEITTAVNDIDHITQENAHMADQMTEQSQDLHIDANQLKDRMSQFYVRDPARANATVKNDRRHDSERAAS